MGYSKEVYNARKAAGLCVLCGHKAREGKTTCQRCYDHQRAYNSQRASNPKMARKLSDRRIELYEQKKKEHRCVSCGKPLDADRKILTCPKCNERARASCRKYALKARESKE